MTVVRAQVALERDTAMPADDTSNNFYAIVDDPVTTIKLTAFADSVQSLYQLYGASLSNMLSGNGEINIFDLKFPEPRIPAHTQTFTFTPGTTAMPGEVALALSFHGTFESGQPSARRRGRVFMGPLDNEVSASGGNVRPSLSQRQGLADRGTALLAASTASADWQWVVFSPTTFIAGGGVLRNGDPPLGLALEAASFPVIAGWVDDAFDTIRSRGVEPAIRTLWS